MLGKGSCWLTAGCLILAIAACSQAPDRGSGSLAGALDRARKTGMLTSCQNNLKQLGIVVKMYAGEHRDSYPPLWSGGRALMFDPDSIWPEYMSDLSILMCPADTQTAAEMKEKHPVYGKADEFFAASSYVYLGYVLTNEETGLAFTEAYRKLLDTGQQPGDTVVVKHGAGIEGGDSVPRLREGIEKSIPGGQAAIPIVICLPGHHEGIGNVLFMDGHVELIHYPGKFPMTEKFVTALQAVVEGKGGTETETETE